MTNLDAHPKVVVLGSDEPCTTVEVLESRQVPLGGIRAMTVNRTLPQRHRSLVGAWCFLDHYGPDDVAETGGMIVPRHPHTGLATVSWLFSGAIDHLDSGGNKARVEPGSLNLMIAGRGITHQEISTEETDILHGVQLWYALPDSTRFAENQFVHYRPEPVHFDGGSARVFIGELLGSKSPVDTLTPELLGAEISLAPGAKLTLDARPDFEYAVLAENTGVTVNGKDTPHRSLAYIPTGSEQIEIVAGSEPSRLMLIGGVPLGEEIVMWWNFIGRSHDEIVEYRRRYQAELGFDEMTSADDEKRTLYGDFPEGQAGPLPAPPMPNARLKPRG